jgi:CheY-like chemotaxis protein
MDVTRVLVVDDHAIFIEMATFVLEAAGYAVQCAGSAQQALEIVPVFRPDLILMDIQMPVMDGLALTRQLKADPATQSIVILAFTAFAVQGDAAPLRAAGFDGYVAKPVDVMTLAAEVAFWLEAPASARASRFVWP